MRKTITVVLEVEGDDALPECDDDLQRIFDDSDINGMVGPDTVNIQVTDFYEGDKLSLSSNPPVHFSDRELAERGLPTISYASDDMGRAIRIERGMMGFFKANPYTSDDVEKLNKAFKVTSAQAEAMHMGSMFGWHVPAAWPSFHTGTTTGRIVDHNQTLLNNALDQQAPLRKKKT